MSFDGVEFLWMNGRIRPWAEGTLPVASHALHYGSGVFEGIRCYETDDDGPAIFRLGPHLARLYASADFYQMRIPYSPEELTQAFAEHVSRNGFSDCYLRPIAFTVLEPWVCILGRIRLRWRSSPEVGRLPW
jgi:branched-chain amino acid aminotransferase